MSQQYKQLAVLITILYFCQQFNSGLCYINDENDANKQLIILSAPQKNDEYYKKYYSEIIDFQARLANSIIGKDNVIILGDKDAIKDFQNKGIKQEILLESPQGDIWARDFTSVFPTNPAIFKYRPTGEEAFIQKNYNQFAEKYGIQFKKSDLVMDGGNFVHNGKDKAIVTDKIYLRNPTMSKTQVIDEVKKQTGVKEVAVIPRDEDYLGHSDGQVSFIDENTVLMNAYSTDAEFAQKVLKALQDGLTGVQIKTIEGEGYGKNFGKYASACGIYVNSIVTKKYVYMPTYQDENKNKKALEVFNTYLAGKKTVVETNAQNVCFMGGSSRCLSSQMEGENAKKLILAARKSAEQSSSEKVLAYLQLVAIFIICLTV